MYFLWNIYLVVGRGTFLTMCRGRKDGWVITIPIWGKPTWVIFTKYLNNYCLYLVFLWLASAMLTLASSASLYLKETLAVFFFKKQQHQLVFFIRQYVCPVWVVLLFLFVFTGFCTQCVGSDFTLINMLINMSPHLHSSSVMYHGCCVSQGSVPGTHSQRRRCRKTYFQLDKKKESPIAYKTRQLPLLSGIISGWTCYIHSSSPHVCTTCVFISVQV